MIEHRCNKQRRHGLREAVSCVVITTVVLWLGLALLAPAAVAFPVRGDESWADEFDSVEGIKEFSNTKVASGSLRLGEGEQEDLGVAVPGESAVYAVLVTGLGSSGKNVYCGTGERGHLAEHDPDELYQEGYGGPTHWGVSNSRGQPWATSIETETAEELRVLSLTADGVQYVYGGTGGTDPDGSLIRFEPYDGAGDPFQRPIEDLGVAVAGGGDVLALAYNGTSVFGGTSSGNLFYYDGSFTDLGPCPSTSGEILSLTCIGPTVYGGTGSGDLFSYNGGFTNIGPCPGTTGAIKSLADDGATVYGGTADGDVFSFDGGFSDLDQPPGANAINALAVSGTDLFIGSQDGHLYRYDIAVPDGFDDQGIPSNSGGEPINSLSVGDDGKVYGGTGDGTGEGHLFSQSGFEDHDTLGVLAGSPITGIAQMNRSLYISNEAGNLYLYNGEDSIIPLGSPGSPINDIDARIGSVFLGMEGGSLYFYNGVSFEDLGKPDPGDIDPITAVLVRPTAVYLGLSDGRLYSYSISGRVFTPIGTLSGAVSDLEGMKVGEDPWTLFIGTASGDLYSYAYPTLENHGPAPADATALNGLAVHGTDVYAGKESGKLFSWDGSSWSASLGDCGSPVKRLAPGNQGVLAGTDGGHLWIYDGSLRDAGTVPEVTAVRSLRRIGEHVFGGTEGGKLFSHQDAFLADMGQPVKKQIMIYCMVYDPNENLVYAGTYREAHFLIIDPATDKVWDRGRAVNGEREMEDIVVATDGTVYGGTYAGTLDIHNPNGGRLFTFDPDPLTGGFNDLGEPPAPDDNWWVSALAEGPGPDRLLYVATSNSLGAGTEGYLFSYDISEPVPADRWTDLGPPSEDEGIRALVLNTGDDKIYGGTWKVGSWENAHLFSYEEGPGGGLHLFGEEPPVPEYDRYNMSIATLSYLDGKLYGGEDNGYVFSFDTGDEEYDFAQKPVSGTVVVPEVVTGPGNTIWCGTRVQGVGNGHLVNYDPELKYFRDVCETQFDPPYQEQDTVASIAFASSGTLGTLYGGTMMGSWLDDEHDYGPCHLFKMDPYRTGTEPSYPYGLSTDIAPGLRELGTPVAGQDAVGALTPAPGDIQVVYGGTANDGESPPDAHLFMYNHATGQVEDFDVAQDGHQKILALCAGTDGYIYGGTANDGESPPDARLFRFRPVFHHGQLIVEDLDVPLAGNHGIFSLAPGQDGKIYIGTGDKGVETDWDDCHLVEYDPGSGQFQDRGELEGTQGRLSALVAGTDGIIYGGTGASPGQTTSAHFIKYDPSTGVLQDKGVQFGSEHSVHSVTQGSDGRIYWGTGPSGRLVSYDIAGGTFNHESAGWPYTGDAPVLSLAATDSAVLGCAGNVGRLFSFTTPGSEFTDMGPPAFGNTGVPAATTDNLGKPCFGTAAGPSVEAKLVRYDPGLRFQWDRVTYVPAPGEQPAGTTAEIDVVDESGGSLDYDNVASGADISGIDPTANPVIRLKGRLETGDPFQSPRVDEWGVTWRDLPGIDEVFPAQAYRGDYLYIWGSNFGDTPGAVTVGGAAVAHGAWYDNMVQVEVPAGAADGDVIVTVGGDPSNTGTFSLLEQPQVTSVSPSSAHLGDIVEVKGSWFLDQRGVSYVSFAGAGGSEYPLWSDGKIKVRVPAGATTGDLAVNVNGHLSNSVAFTVLAGGGPSVDITKPEDGSAVTGVQPVEATVESIEKVDRVEFLIDGELIGTDKSAPYECEWNADGETDGAHTLEASAYDALGRKGQDEVTVYVDHTVPGPSDQWYFAEGCTDYGFETWLLIGNPADEATVAHVTFMDDTGNIQIGAYDLLADSRTTINAAAEFPNANLSMEVRAGHDVICERAMYWNGRVEGHGSIGTTSLSENWYFAEGCTDYGFETYVLIGNPGDGPVDVTLRYMFDDGGVHTTDHRLQPQSRLTVDAFSEVGPGEFSMQVESGEPGVVAERAMYFGGRNCGTGTIGCKAPSTTWYLSEGSTDWGFETWLLIGRPGDGDARVTVTYRKSSGETVEKTYIVRGNSRHTVNLQTAVGIADVSTQVSSDVPVVCERAMYWNNRAAGHCTVGSPGPGTTWYLAEGCTDYGFETWLLLDNPTGEDLATTVTFMKQDGSVVPVQLQLPAHCRTSLDAADYVPASSFSTRVAAAGPVMVERAMYWNGREGGTGSIGAR